MACIGNKETVNYAIYEYDSSGKAVRSDKVFTLTSEEQDRQVAKYGRLHAEGLLLAFFKEMFGTISTTSGFIAEFPDSYPPDSILIRWRLPTWKLIKI